MKTIVAVDKNWGIGKDGGLLTNLPEDMNFFRTTTLNKVVVMGRKTLESFPGGKPLKNRINLVLTADQNYHCEGITVFYTMPQLLKALAQYETEEIYIIGGGSVYKQFLPFCDTAYVTRMDADLSPDTYFVNLNQEAGWNLEESGEDKVLEGLHYQFCTYKNLNPADLYL